MSGGPRTPPGPGSAGAGALGAAGLEIFGPLPAESVVEEGRSIEWADPDEPLERVASRMWWRQMGVLPVLEDERLIGCVDEDDLVRVLAQRLVERKEQVEDEGDGLPVWEGLLDGATARDSMTPRDELVVVPAGTPLLDGVRRTARRTSTGSRNHYVLVADGSGHLIRLVSMRDVARLLTAVYDGRLAAAAADDPNAAEPEGVLARRVLDTDLGTLRERHVLGREPVVGPEEAGGDETLRRLWEGRRGYLLAAAPDGSPLGICTRRDVLRALRNPFAKLADLAMARLMSVNVKTVRELDTLVGLFKLMAIEGCRHMPLLDPSDRVECVISMGEGIALLADSHPDD
jgi:CBS-domain-containing membrane protein